MGIFWLQIRRIFGLALLMVSYGVATAQPQATPSARGNISSTFAAGHEGWQVVGDAQDGASIPDWHSSGGNPSGFIMVEDDVAGGTWYWQAPDHFLGNRVLAYQTDLTFDLRQSETDNQFDAADVILIGNDITLEFDTAVNPATTWTSYRVPLDEQAGWIIQATGIAPTASEMQSVLSNLTTLWIRGEFRDGPDTGGLDNVTFSGFQATTVVFLPFVRR
ncbi:laminin B domain-containing protein [Herpetosiphon giganteus]|uniref:laminin B domain-containing protein n=1 Tax=Herpetosiphon giganteus TaxID=2029754 RepID=UPI00195C8DFE|nr:hypothetical protein [Herpetosiphon giganteus]